MKDKLTELLAAKLQVEAGVLASCSRGIPLLGGGQEPEAALGIGVPDQDPTADFFKDSGS